jgi:ankyrin repeat protein
MEPTPRENNVIREQRFLSLQFVKAAEQDALARHMELHREGASVHAWDGGGRSALSWAAINGNAEAMAFLVQAGAEADHPDDGGNTPVHLATLRGHEDGIRVLAAARADLDRKNGDGKTPLFIAQSSGDDKTAILLLSLGADPNVRGRDGESAVFRAAARGQWRLATELIRKGAHTLGEDAHFRSLDDLARASGNEDLIDALNESRAELFMPRARKPLVARPPLRFRRP